MSNSELLAQNNRMQDSIREIPRMSTDDMMIGKVGFRRRFWEFKAELHAKTLESPRIMTRVEKGATMASSVLVGLSTISGMF